MARNTNNMSGFPPTAYLDPMVTQSPPSVHIAFQLAPRNDIATRARSKIEVYPPGPQRYVPSAQQPSRRYTSFSQRTSTDVRTEQEDYDVEARTWPTEKPVFTKRVEHWATTGAKRVFNGIKYLIGCLYLKGEPWAVKWGTWAAVVVVWKLFLEEYVTDITKGVEQMVSMKH